MNSTIIIKYDLVDDTISVDCGDLTTFESFGLLEAAKAMVAEKWIKNPKTNREDT